MLVRFVSFKLVGKNANFVKVVLFSASDSTSVYFEAGINEYFLFFRFNFIGKLVLFV